MDEEIVPYEEALELEKLGCNMHCWGSCYYEFYDRGNIYILLKTPDDMNMKDGVNAPTFSQAFKWFREKYNQHHFIHYHSEPSYIFAVLNDIEMYWTLHENISFKTYEEAELACLRKLIEIVKTNKDTLKTK